MNRPIIAIDIDDVLVPHAFILLDYLNKHYDKQALIHRFYSLEELIEGLGTTEEDLQTAVHDFLRSLEFENIGPTEGAVEAVAKLKEKYDLVILTARPAVVHEMTDKWLIRHFPNVFKDVFFANQIYDWGRGVTNTSKLELAKQAEVLIDDSLKHCVELAEAGGQGLLFGNYPWNQADVLPNGVRRVKDWDEVLEVLGV